LEEIIDLFLAAARNESDCTNARRPRATFFLLLFSQYSYQLIEKFSRLIDGETQVIAFCEK